MFGTNVPSISISEDMGLNDLGNEGTGGYREEDDDKESKADGKRREGVDAENNDESNTTSSIIPSSPSPLAFLLCLVCPEETDFLLADSNRLSCDSGTVLSLLG